MISVDHGHAVGRKLNATTIIAFNIAKVEAAVFTNHNALIDIGHSIRFKIELVT